MVTAACSIKANYKKYICVDRTEWSPLKEGFDGRSCCCTSAVTTRITVSIASALRDPAQAAAVTAAASGRSACQSSRSAVSKKSRREISCAELC